MENHNHHLESKRDANHKIYSNKSIPIIQVIKEKLLSYKPLIVIFIFCLILSFVQNYFKVHQLELLMYSFMGYFLVFLSMFKFFDLEGFVDGFSTYDIITRRFKLYGYIYPFIELCLGISYLANFYLFLVNWIVLVVMTIGSVGVLRGIMSDQKIKCACLGTILNVPLSIVSILENFGMGVMAAYKLSLEYWSI